MVSSADAKQDAIVNDGPQRADRFGLLLGTAGRGLFFGLLRAVRLAALIEVSIQRRNGGAELFRLRTAVRDGFYLQVEYIEFFDEFRLGRLAAFQRFGARLALFQLGALGVEPVMVVVRISPSFSLSCAISLISVSTDFFASRLLRIREQVP